MEHVCIIMSDSTVYLSTCTDRFVCDLCVYYVYSISVCVSVTMCAVIVYVNRPGFPWKVHNLRLEWQDEGLRSSQLVWGSCISGKPVEVAEFVTSPPWRHCQLSKGWGCTLHYLNYYFFSFHSRWVSSSGSGHCCPRADYGRSELWWFPTSEGRSVCLGVCLHVWSFCVCVYVVFMWLCLLFICGNVYWSLAFLGRPAVDLISVSQRDSHRLAF